MPLALPYHPLALALVLVAGAALWPRQASGQETPPAQEAPAPEAPPQEAPPQKPAPTGEDGLTDAEREALLQSLSADQAAEPAPSVPAAPSLPWVGAGSSGNPDISLILDVAGAYFSQDPLQSGAHDPNKTGFTFQQLEMHIEHSVDPFFRLDANIVFAQFGVEVEEAYATTLAAPANLQLRFGQFLTRFGRQNPTHPHAWFFMDLPLVSGKFFGGEGSRGLGVETSWLAPTPWYLELVGSVNDATGECCARSFYGGQDLGVDSPADLLGTLALKQFFELGDSVSLLWGLSYQGGPNPTGQDNRTEIYGTDLYLRYRPEGADNRSSLSWSTEAMLRRRQVAGGVLQDWGGFSQVVYQLDASWETGVRYEYASGLAQDALDPDWTEARRRVAVQGTYYPSHFSRLRLQANYDKPGWREEPILALMLNAEVLVGAHGAHTY